LEAQDGPCKVLTELDHIDDVEAGNCSNIDNGAEDGCNMSAIRTWEGMSRSFELSAVIVIAGNSEAHILLLLKIASWTEYGQELDREGRIRDGEDEKPRNGIAFKFQTQTCCCLWCFSVVPSSLLVSQVSIARYGLCGQTKQSRPCPKRPKGPNACRNPTLLGLCQGHLKGKKSEPWLLRAGRDGIHTLRWNAVPAETGHPRVRIADSTLPRALPISL
jgi:hypothetical protein